MTHSAIGVRSCEQCGSALASRALFCSSCGTAVPRDLRSPDPVARPKAWFEQDGEQGAAEAAPEPAVVTDRVQAPEPEVAEVVVPQGEGSRELVEETPPIGIGLEADPGASGPETAPLGLPLPVGMTPELGEPAAAPEPDEPQAVAAEPDPEPEPEAANGSATARPAVAAQSWSWDRESRTPPAPVVPAAPPAQASARTSGFADPQTGPMSIIPAAASSWSAGRVSAPASTSLRVERQADRLAASPPTSPPPLESLRPSTDSNLSATLVRPPTPDYRVVELGGSGASSTWASRTELVTPSLDATAVEPAALGHGLPPSEPTGRRDLLTRPNLLRVGVPVLVAVLAMAGVLMLFRSRSDAGAAQSQTLAADPRAAAVRSWQDGNAAWSRGDITLVCDRYDGVGAQGMWATVARCQSAERQGYDSTSGADRSTIAGMTVDPTTTQTLPDGSVVIWYRNARVGANPVAIFGNDDFAVMRQLDGQGWRQVGARYSGTVVGTLPAGLSASVSSSRSASPSS